MAGLGVSGYQQHLLVIHCPCWLVGFCVLKQ
jgi:hypothetical protein